MSLATSARASGSPLGSLAEKVVLSAGSRIRVGRLSVHFPDGSSAVFGVAGAEPSAAIRVHDDRFFHRVLFGGEIGLGEAYMDGLWSTDDLVGLLTLLVLNRRKADVRGLAWLGWLARVRNRRRHVARRNTRQQARENIHEHYDLGNEFFRLFLDETMTYSSAVFSREGGSLADAQRNKDRALCEMAEMKAGESVLEIGTGWGGFAMYAAQRHACKVTTISISQEQVALAKKRVTEAGLSSLVDVKFQDYREVTGQFDKIVSIEMFEAVGAEYFETFFRTCAAALRPGGLLCMQVITVPERAFAAQKNGVNWVQKHIFPGGVLPSLAAMERALAPTALLMTDVREIGLHYAVTLRQWRERFVTNVPGVRALGFTDVFIRKWEYYLAACEAGFLTRTIGDVQVRFEKVG